MALLCFLLVNVLLDISQTFADAACKPFCNIPSSWINQEQNVCYGAKDDDFGTFRLKQDCRLVAIRLRHISGYVTCNKNKKIRATKWGCNMENCHEKPCFSTVITKPNKELLVPREIDQYGKYHLDGFSLDDEVFFSRTRYGGWNLTAGDELQVWYGFDWMDLGEAVNQGRHCVDVDVSCLE